MPRYVAFLRGVSPTNASMPALKRCFEGAGFTNVRTLLSSGNVAFDARASSVDALQRRAEKAMQADLERGFATIVRSSEHLQHLVAVDPFTAFALPANAKRVVTFLREGGRHGALKLPLERDGASILKVIDGEAFSAYVASDKGPVFMTLLERTFGADITTRTFDTVKKCAVA
jgi:uncharacterized protein (DUF1697 family)